MIKQDQKPVEYKTFSAFVGVRMKNGDNMVGLFECDLEKFDHKLVRACVKHEIIGAQTVLVVVK